MRENMRSIASPEEEALYRELNRGLAASRAGDWDLADTIGQAVVARDGNQADVSAIARYKKEIARHPHKP